MQINKKDKLFLLFIATALILLWAGFSLLSYIFYNSYYHKSQAANLVKSKNISWLNVEKKPQIEDLKNRIIVVNFSDFSSANSLYASLELQNLSEKFSGRILVISVNSSNLTNEKDDEVIKTAAEKYSLQYPIINDLTLEISKKFKLKKIPTIFLLNPYGRVVGEFSEYDQEKLENHIRKLLKKHFLAAKNNNLVKTSQTKETAHILNFPTKITFAEKFEFNDYKGSAIFISSSADNKIVVSSLSGKLITRIGSGQRGLIDGDFGSAAFNLPRGLLFADNKLYVADSANNALRIIDFIDQDVKTVIGSGKIGKQITNEQKAQNTDLAMPWDLEFFPDEQNIAISNAATNQILQYNVKQGTIKAIANNLNQPAGLKAFNSKLYFVDSKNKAIKAIAKSGGIATIVKSDELQYPTDLTIDNSGIYITDSYDHQIKRLDPASKKISAIIGSKNRGDGISAAKNTEFDEPEGLVSISNIFYIVDSNNHRIVKVARGNSRAEILDILPPLQLSKDQILKYLPNLQKLDNISVAQEEVISLKINLPEDFKINDKAPSFVNLLELVDKKEANLIAAFDWNMIASKTIKLPKLKGDYILQGTIYYCEDKENALCYIKSVEQKIQTAKFSKITLVTINLGR